MNYILGDILKESTDINSDYVITKSLANVGISKEIIKKVIINLQDDEQIRNQTKD